MNNIGKCRFCTLEKNLRSSHIIPKGIFRIINGQENKGFIYYDNQKNTLKHTKKQLQEYLLCHCCEQHFSKNENLATPIIKAVSAFPYNKRSLLANIFPENAEVSNFRSLNSNKLDENDLKVFNFFTINKAEVLKFYCLSILIRDYYLQEYDLLSSAVISKIENYLKSKDKLNVQMHIYINTNEDDYPMGGTPYIMPAGEYIHTHFIFPNIFVYLHFRENDSIANDTFIIIPIDFYQNNDDILPFKVSTDVFRQVVAESNKDNNLKGFDIY